MSGADIVDSGARRRGRRDVFGYSGGAILPTYDAVFRYNKAHRARRRRADAADRAGERAGRRFHGGGLCTRERPRRRRDGDVRARRDEHA